jgi:hypothetical protein
MAMVVLIKEVTSCLIFISRLQEVVQIVCFDSDIQTFGQHFKGNVGIFIQEIISKVHQPFILLCHLFL